MRLLILGGSTEATRLAERLAARPDLRPVLSLAGRTERPALPRLPYRIGGFGGPDGLAAYLRTEGIAALVDATHPFAARMSANAVAACAEAGVPLAVLTRPPWTPEPGDSWSSVPDLDAAAAALGPKSRRVFLTSGRLGLASFKQAPQHAYLLRSIDPPPEADRPQHCDVILARGPFDQAGEETLMRRHGIEVLVSKNSGGENAKLRAARRLGIPVVMVDRPPSAGLAPGFTDIDAVLDWIEERRTAHRPAP